MAGLALWTVGLGPNSNRAPAAANDGRLAAGGVLHIRVPEAFGGKTVVGQLTVDRVSDVGFVTAYGCTDGIPTDAGGNVTRSDLNYDGRVSSVASNRLIVKADDAGDICLYTLRPAALIVDINGVTFDTGINSFVNHRSDSRTGPGAERISSGGVMRIRVPEATGGKTVVGQLTADQVDDAGFVTAYGCADGIPTDAGGNVTRSDLNYDGRVSPVASNRLIVKADANGDICLYTLRPAALIADINGVADVGITTLPNRRTDTRRGPTAGRLDSGGVLRIRVPEATGGKTVIGQLTVDQVDDVGFVTAYGCADGIPTDADGTVDRSDLNFYGRVSPVASNRLIVKADANGEVCFYTLRPAALIVDVNGVTDVGISSFTNRRADTRNPSAQSGTISIDGVPVWPDYVPLAGLQGVAALTGLPTDPADPTFTTRPILAVKIDNYGPARPQWGLDDADAIIEENVEGVTRFIALFHSRLPGLVGPVRSARTGDLDLLIAMNRPVFAFSGANPGVGEWVDSAATSGLLVDFTAQANPCFVRTPDRPGPHNLLLDPVCAVSAAADAGAARPLWSIKPSWTPGAVDADSTFTVGMDGVRIDWTWDAGSGTYLRWQDGLAHMTADGAQIRANNVVEIVTEYVPSPVDARSPNAITVGTGDAVVHRDGHAVPVTWSRATPYDAFKFADAAGQPVPLDSGTTFVELIRA